MDDSESDQSEAPLVGGKKAPAKAPAKRAPAKKQQLVRLTRCGCSDRVRLTSGHHLPVLDDLQFDDESESESGSESEELEIEVPKKKA